MGAFRFKNQVNHNYSKNYTIAMIISEEVPAYFEGRKRLDEVISVINSGVGTMAALIG